MPNSDTPHITINSSMIFITWLTDLTKIQGVVNNIKGIELLKDNVTKLLEPSVVNDLSSAINGLNLQQAQLALSTRKLTQDQMNQVLVGAGLIASEDKIKGELLQSALVQAGVSAEKQRAILTELGLMDAITGEIYTTKACNKEELLNMLATKGVTGANAEAIISILGVGEASKKSTLSLGLFTKATWEQIKAQAVLLASNPVTWIVLGLVALVGVLDLVTTSTAEYDKELNSLRDNLENAKSECSELKSELKSCNDELTTTQERIKELEKIESPTFVEKEEYDNLIATNNELERKNALLELEEKVKNAEKNKAFIDTMQKDVNDDNEYWLEQDTGNIYKGDSTWAIIGGIHATDSTEADFIEQQFATRRYLFNKLAEAETEEEKDKIQNCIDEIDSYLQNKSSEWNKDSEEISYILNPTSDDERAVNEWLDYIADFQDRMAITISKEDAEANARYKANTFNRLVDNHQFDDTVQGLQNLGKEGKVTAEMLDDPKYDEFINKLVFLGVIDSAANLDTVALAFNSVAIAAENAADSTQKYNHGYSFSFSDILSYKSLSQFQSTIDSLKSSLTTLYSGNYSSTDLISALTNVNSVLSDIGKSDVINWEKITNIADLDNVIDQITSEYIDTMLDSWDIAGTEFGNIIRNVIQEELKASRQLETYKSNVSDLQTAYSNLTDVIDTYNANGYITFDQLTSLLEMEPQYLSCLIDDNGQLQLNTQAMADLAQLRLDEAKAQVVQETISELNRLSEEKQTQAVNDNSNAYIQNIRTISQWNEALGIAMQNAGLAVPLFAELSTAIGGAVSNGVSDEAIGQVLDNAYKKFQMIGQIQSSIGSNLGGILGKTSSSLTSSSTDNYEELFDFFERRVEVLDDAVKLLNTNLENVTGSFAKNQLLDQSSNILEERIHNYSDAAKMYQEKVQESLSRLDAETQRKIIDGSVSLTDYIGEGNEAVVEAMKDYQGWADKVAECTEELASLKEELRQLELDKFNHIVQDFTDQFDLRDNAKNLIDKQISLFEEAGQLIGKAFYEEQIDQSQKQLSLLENEKAKLVSQMTSAIGSGRIQKGTGEWLEMVNALSDVDSSILDCKKSIEEYDNAILNLHWEVFDRIQNAFEDLSDEIDNLIGMIDDSDVATKDNQWTKEGLTQLGLYAQQYELATYQVSQYADQMDKLNADYLLGKYSATEYSDKLSDLSSAQWDAVNAAESAKDSIMDLNKARISIVTEGIQEEINAYKELTDAQINALDAEKDLHDYQISIAEKSKNIAGLEKQLAAMQYDNTSATVARRKQLEEQLAEARADLDETQYDHSVETQKESLNQQYTDFEEARNKEIEALEATLEDRENIIAASMDSVKQNTQVIADQITEIADQHGIKVSDALTKSWTMGENAIASYGEVLSLGTSAFIGNIIAIEAQIYQLQTDADITAVSLASMFGANADNLVSELNTSYFAEYNLLSVTNALHDSLINTLQSGYDVSNIVNSLNAVTDAANRARAAASGLSTVNTSIVPTISNNPSADRKFFVKDENSKTLYAGNLSQCQTWISAHNYSLGSFAGDDINVIDNNKKSSASTKLSKAKAPIMKYAAGTRNITKAGPAITNEDGQELIYHASDGSILTRLQPGDKVFSNASAERLYQLGQGILPADITPSFKLPSVNNSRYSSNAVNMNYDHLIEINGNVNDTNNFIKQISTIAEKAIENAVTTAEKTRKYGMF